MSPVPLTGRAGFDVDASHAFHAITLVWSVAGFGGARDVSGCDVGHHL